MNSVNSTVDAATSARAEVSPSLLFDEFTQRLLALRVERDVLLRKSRSETFTFDDDLDKYVYNSALTESAQRLKTLYQNILHDIQKLEMEMDRTPENVASRNQIHTLFEIEYGKLVSISKLRMTRLESHRQRFSVTSTWNEPLSENEKLDIDSGAGTMSVLEQIKSLDIYPEWERQDREIAERHRDILKIGSTLGEVADLQNHLDTLVAAQAPLLDRIEVNVDHAVDDLQTARQELATANRTQKKTAARTRFMGALLAAIGVVGGAIVLRS